MFPLNSAHVRPCKPCRVQRILRPSNLAAAADGAEGPGGANVPTPNSKEALLARIAKAKQYKEQGGSTPTIASPTTTPPVTPAPGTLLRAPVDWGAMTQFLKGPSGQQSNSQGASAALAPVAPAANPSNTGLTGDQPSSPAPAPQNDSGAGTSSIDNITTSAMDKDHQELLRMIQSAPRKQGAGSGTEAADFLKGVLQTSNPLLEGLNKDMRMEEFTLAKEERIKQLGAEIITVDQSYNPGISISRNQGVTSPSSASQDPSTSSSASTSDNAEDVSMYRPKVSTWGMFPRPADISKAYGGGRNILPGQHLETKEQQQQREAEYAAALKQYRAKMGLEVDPELEEQAMKLYEAGMVLFKQGQLRASYQQFDKASQLVPTRTKAGGLATLQKAVILDSLGQSDDAKPLYKQLRGHAVSDVSRKAKMMLFGFEASNFMKAETMSYAAKKEEYDRFFRRLTDRNRIYVATEEEKARDAQQAKAAALIAVAVLLGPVALFGSLLATH